MRTRSRRCEPRGRKLPARSDRGTKAPFHGRELGVLSKADQVRAPTLRSATCVRGGAGSTQGALLLRRRCYTFRGHRNVQRTAWPRLLPSRGQAEISTYGFSGLLPPWHARPGIPGGVAPVLTSCPGDCTWKSVGP